MGFTREFLLESGFKDIDAATAITATFQSVNIYQINGLTFDDNTSYTRFQAGNGITFSYGNDLNKICMSLVNDSWMDTQQETEKWQKDNNTKPPYLMLVTSMATPVTATTGYWQRNKNGVIETYDTFTGTRKQLQQTEKQFIPSILIALSAQLSTNQRVVYFKHVTKFVDAVTLGGDRLLDSTVGFSADLSTAEKILDSQMVNAVQAAINNQAKTLPKASFWLQAGVAEVDKFKKFRCFFLAIEIYTKHTYKQIKQQCKNLDLKNTRIAAAVVKHQKKIDDDKKRTSVFVQFLWCAAIQWPQITEQDIDLADSLITIRNDAMHGEITTDDNFPYHPAHLLATKLFK